MSQHKSTAASLLPGKTYWVVKLFVDYDGFWHRVGECWRPVEKSFLPYEDGLTLKIEQEGQLTGIRLKWRDDVQGLIIDNFSNYIKEE